MGEPEGQSPQSVEMVAELRVSPHRRGVVSVGNFCLEELPCLMAAQVSPRPHWS